MKREVIGIALSALAGLSTFGAPTNDDFASATVVTGSPVVFSGSLVDSSSGSLWWTWIAPTGGVAELTDLIPSLPWDLSHSVGMYEGNSLTSLVEVASSSGLAPLYFAAQAGQAYHLAFTGDTGIYQDVLYQLVLYDPPSNDNFADRLPLQPGVTNNACNALDTTEPGEPDNPFGVQHTLWWTWTARAVGVVNPQPDENTSIDVYTGSTLSELVPMPETNAYGVAGYGVSPGQTLQIRADNDTVGSLYSILGHVQFALQFTGMATNDQFADRSVLTGFPVDVRGDNSLATAEPGEPQHMGEAPGHTVWYEWTAPKSQRVAILVDSASGAPIDSVYKGDSLSNLVCVAGKKALLAPLTFSAARGRTYQIAVGGAFGPFRLRIVGPPANDNFSAAYVLSGIHDESESYTTCATFEPGEPNLVRYNSRQSVWWRWQAPVSGWVRLNVVAGYDVPLQVFTGDRVSHLQPVPLEVEALMSPSTRVSSFLAASGVTYHISASGQRSRPFEERQVITQNGSIALGLTEATVRLNLYSDSSTLLAPKTVAAVAVPVFTNLGLPTNLVFTEIYRYWPTDQDVSAAPWSCTFSNLPAGRHTFSASGTNAAGDWQFSTQININLRPPNDDFTARIVTNSLPLALAGSLAGASREAGEPELSPHETASVWYSWTAPSNVLVHIYVDVGTVGIYEGDSLSTLHLLRRLHVGAQSFHAIANKTYQLKASTSSDPDFSYYSVSFAQ